MISNLREKKKFKHEKTKMEASILCQICNLVFNFYLFILLLLLLLLLLFFFFCLQGKRRELKNKNKK